MRIKIAALCGSLRQGSYNRALIEAIRALESSMADIDLISFADLPLFNPDISDENQPQTVLRFRRALSQADCILISTPEYAMGAPGALKNAIDWTVGSCELAHKPTALITCSSLGQKAHAALIDVLAVLEAKFTPDTLLLISHNRLKISLDNQIIDEATKVQVCGLMKALYRLNITHHRPPV